MTGETIEVPGGAVLPLPEGFRDATAADPLFSPQDYALAYRGHRATLSGSPRFDDAMAIGEAAVTGSGVGFARLVAQGFRDADWKVLALERLDGPAPLTRGEIEIWTLTIPRPGFLRARQKPAVIATGMAADGTHAVAVFLLGDPDDAERLVLALVNALSER